MAEALPGSLTTAIEQAAGLLGHDPVQAERQAEAILKIAPNDPRAALVLGSARRRGGDPAAALAVLGPLARAFPRAARTHYELGLALAALGDTVGAVAALRHAVGLNRDMAEAWRALGDQLFLAGETAAAETAFAEHVRASVTDPALVPAANAVFEGRTTAAEQMLRTHLQRRPDDPTALRMLAETAAGRGRLDEAEALLRRCLEINPSQDGARFTHADVLFRQQKGSEALAQLQPLLERDPENPAYRNLHAACLGLVGEHERSIEIYEGLLAVFAGQPKLWLNYGHALRTTGRRDAAVAAYKRCIALAPGLGDAYWSLANLKVEPFTAAEEAAMRAQLNRPDLDPEDRLHLHYALGKALEDQGDHGDSFRHYEAGAALRRSQLAYDAGETTALVRRSKALFTPGFFAARAAAGSASEAPIFIVGLPRAGSTLIEQILASHPEVEGVMELPDVARIAADVMRAAGPAAPYPDVLAGLDPGALTALGERYLDSTRVHRRLGRRFFIDKMPNNFLHLGLIQLILPMATIIDARRHPMASCFSAYKQHFATGQAFSYDLADLGRYYRDYVELMAHFDDVLPGRVHRVIYEAMVEDTEAEIRRLLDHCGLPFDPACLRFYENDRAVRTVSSEQVRRPIFRQGLDQWRRYEAWLGPLQGALGPALQTWRGAASSGGPSVLPIRTSGTA